MLLIIICKREKLQSLLLARKSLYRLTHYTCCVSEAGVIFFSLKGNQRFLNGPFPWKGQKLCIFCFWISHNKLLNTSLACLSHTWDYWPSAIFVQTLMCSVCTTTEEGEAFYTQDTARRGYRQLFCALGRESTVMGGHLWTARCKAYIPYLCNDLPNSG